MGKQIYFRKITIDRSSTRAKKIYELLNRHRVNIYYFDKLDPMKRIDITMIEFANLLDDYLTHNKL